MKILMQILRIIVGIVFAFSGFVKAVDPVGTQIKFEDYFIALGLDFMIPFALLLSFLLNAGEFIIGLMLIVNIFPKLALWGAFILMIIFLPLTLWLAVYNTVTDCGCFGDFITLSNWETFYKNLVIIALIIVLVIFRKQLTAYFSKKISFILFASFIVITLGFEYYNYTNLPVFDFRAYKKGVNIKDEMTVPENAPKDVYESVLVYKNLKTGELKEFTLENYPEGDTLNWAFETSINKLISEGYKPSIYDFVISDLQSNDITEEILANKNYSFVLVSYDLEISKLNDLKSLRIIADFCAEKNLKFYVFTATSSSLINKYVSKYPHNLIFCTADKKMLKTMIRSNPGLFILKDAVVIDKFHFKNFPDKEKLSEIIINTPAN